MDKSSINAVARREQAKNIVNLLEKAADSLTAGAESAGIAFSGGIDSSILAFILKDKCRIALYTVGVENAYDFTASERSARFMNLATEKITIGKNDIRAAIPDVSKLVKSTNPVDVSIRIPLYFAARDCREDILYSGQGADELFGGYKRYLGMDGASLESALNEDLDELIANGIAKDETVASHFGRKLLSPYLDDEFVAFARKIPAGLKVCGNERKIVLRDAATELGLPDFIAGARKKAAQYSSGVMKAIQRLAKDEGMGARQYIEHCSQTV